VKLLLAQAVPFPGQNANKTNMKATWLRQTLDISAPPSTRKSKATQPGSSHHEEVSSQPSMRISR
jgi:hypothetical protein